MQGTRFHAERPRVGYPQLAHDEREHSLGIRLATGLSLTQIQVVPRVKQYGLVFDKRVIDVATRSSHPYGYERIGDELDLLLDL